MQIHTHIHTLKNELYNIYIYIRYAMEMDIVFHLEKFDCMNE